VTEVGQSDGSLGNRSRRNGGHLERKGNRSKYMDVIQQEGDLLVPFKNEVRTTLLKEDPYYQEAHDDWPCS
jgi:hypothetical protein